MKSFALIASAALLSASLAAHADLPGEHPHYLHALSDLRSARWLIDHHPQDWTTADNGHLASRQIDAAIHDLSHAARYDEKDLASNAPVDHHPGYPGQLHDALGYLDQARHDIDLEEDNLIARPFKHQAITHIDSAQRAVHSALAELRATHYEPERN